MDKKANEINCPKYATTTEKKKPALLHTTPQNSPPKLIPPVTS